MENNATRPLKDSETKVAIEMSKFENILLLAFEQFHENALILFPSYHYMNVLYSSVSSQLETDDIERVSKDDIQK